MFRTFTLHEKLISLFGARFDAKMLETARQ